MAQSKATKEPGSWYMVRTISYTGLRGSLVHVLPGGNSEVWDNSCGPQSPVCPGTGGGWERRARSVLPLWASKHQQEGDGRGDGTLRVYLLPHQHEDLPSFPVTYLPASVCSVGCCGYVFQSRERQAGSGPTPILRLAGLGLTQSWHRVLLRQGPFA